MINQLKALVKRLDKKNMLHKETNLELIKREINEATAETMADVLATCYDGWADCRSCSYNLDDCSTYDCGQGHKKLMESTVFDD